MFGGLTFMVAGHMCCGVAKNDVMFRVGSEAAEAALDDRGVRPVDMTGRTLGGMWSWWMRPSSETTTRLPGGSHAASRS